jgi:hypothetical protein
MVTCYHIVLSHVRMYSVKTQHTISLIPRLVHSMRNLHVHIYENSEWNSRYNVNEFCQTNKAVPLPPCRRQGEEEYSFYSFLTSSLDRVSGHRHAPAVLCHPEKDPRYPLDRRLGGPQGWSRHRG